jgi:general secretion pathway protein D
VVIADEKTRRAISNVVATLDRPKPQVLIKVVFVELTLNNSLDFGIEGGWTGSNSQAQAIGAIANAFGLSALHLPASGSNAPTPNVFGMPTSAFGSVPPGAGLYQIYGQDYQATIRAIATAGKSKILSRPSVVARNNQPATITVGQSVPLITNVRYDTLGNAINSVSYTPVGIILRVTPFITGDGMVEMILSPETSQLEPDRTQWVPIATGPSGGSAISAPLINQRSADTVVLTPDGQTVIIGGLMATSKGHTENKIPLLGDIPWLGLLFRHTIDTEIKTELLIFLTPYIIPAPSELATLTAKEKAKSGVSKALTEKELNQYLDTLPTKDADKKDNSKKKKDKEMEW